VRLPALDGVRGIAILLVLLHQLDRIEGEGLATRLVEYAFDAGWVGVQLFFVLSGFLITGILLGSRGTPTYFRSFFVRRVLRIFPVYFGALVLFLWIAPSVGLAPPSWRDHQLWYWLYLSNWTEPFLGGSLPHLWSLAVEEQFYLLWPFVVARLDARDLLRTCVALAVASLMIRAVMLGAGVPAEAVYTFSTSRIDALLLGAAAAIVAREPRFMPRALGAPRTLWFVALGTGVLGFLATHGYPRTSPLGQTVGYSLLSVVFAAAILALAIEARQGKKPSLMARALSSAPLAALGTYSYGMYVFHKPLHDLVGSRVLASMGFGHGLGLLEGLVYVGIGALATLLVGVASYWVLERHFLALKDRFAPRSG